MTSSVSVVRAWERHVSHTSSPIFTEDNDISAAAGRLGFRAAVDWWVRGSAELGPFLGNGCVASLAWLVRVSLRGWAQPPICPVWGHGVQCGWTGRRHCRWGQEFGWKNHFAFVNLLLKFSLSL
jgi:hypothetical protein